MELKSRILVCLALVGALGCRSKAEVKIPELDDSPKLAKVTRTNLPNIAPAYGIALGGDGGQSYQVSLEPADSKLVKMGQKAFVALSPDDSKVVSAQVVRLSRASSETEQTIAVLKAVSASHIPSGEFVFAKVVVGVEKGVLAIPRESIYIKDGFPLVLKQAKGKDGKNSLAPTEVEVGIEVNELTEIKSGLQEGDQVAVEGGIGYLYPNFKDTDDD